MRPRDFQQRIIEGTSKIPSVPLRRLREMWESDVAPAIGPALTSALRGFDIDGITDDADLCLGLLTLAETSSNVLIRGLAAERCWLLRLGAKPYQLAMQAMENYKRLSLEPDWFLSDRTEMLEKALDIGNSLNDRRKGCEIGLILVQVLKKAVTTAPERDSLAVQRIPPGTTDRKALEEAYAERQFHDAMLFALRSLERHRRSAVLRDCIPWDQVAQMGCAAFEEARNDRGLMQALLDPVTRLLQDDEARQKSVHEAYLRSELAWSDTQSPPTQYIVRVNAERQARDVGLPLLAGKLQEEIQAMDIRSSLSPVRTTFSLDQSDMEDIRRQFSAHVFDGDNWRLWLERLALLGGCPLGSHEANCREAEQSLGMQPVHASLPSVKLGPMNVPKNLSESDQVRLSAEVGRIEQSRVLLFFTVLLEPAITELVQRLQIVNLDDLAQFLQSSGFDGKRAEHVARAIKTYLQDVDGAAHKLLPRIEQMLRKSAVLYGSVIDPAKGGVDLLGAILAALEGHVSEDWRQYLRVILTEDAGFNLRNNLLHGLTEEATPIQSAMILHVALVCCFIQQLQV